jgi:hypothetical protein
MNTIFNIFVPVRWIEKDSGTLSFEKKVINTLFFNNYICNNIRNDSSTNNNLKQLTICSDNSNFENTFFKNKKSPSTIKSWLNSRFSKSSSSGLSPTKRYLELENMYSSNTYNYDDKKTYDYNKITKEDEIEIEEKKEYENEHIKKNNKKKYDIIEIDKMKQSYSFNSSTLDSKSESCNNIDDYDKKIIIHTESISSEIAESDNSKKNTDIYNITPELKKMSSLRSEYYSPTLDDNIAMLTFMIPVYNEPFESVIKPTLDNLLLSCQDFNSKFDRKINILVCEDGLQAINDEEEINKRIDYYNSSNDIFYIARKKEGRRGKFKKASNINFSLNMIRKVNKEKIGFEILAEEYDFLYKMNVLFNSKFELGRFVLLVDSDSRIDVGTIQNLIYELMSSDKKIAYLQCRTSTNYICEDNHWERVVGHFTDSIYDISFLYSAANGNPSPLVGHNCLLDWELITNVLKKNKYDDNYSGDLEKRDYIEYWDENGVSEDFALSLDLYINGYFGKYVYFDCGFKEGVTLNVDDEITKFSKYGYGVSEILFNPLKEMSDKGIFSKRTRRFILTENIPLYIKLSIISYIGIYYSMAICPIISLLNFFFFRYSEYYYGFLSHVLENIAITVIVFFILTPTSNIITRARHKLYKTSICKMIGEEIYYDIFLFIFFGGMQYHFLKAMICHMFDLNISWGATNKEDTSYNILSKFRMYYDMYIIGIITIIGCIGAIMYDEKLLNIYSVIPISLNVFFHLIMPLVL